jgi:hypothetical protein
MSRKKLPHYKKIVKMCQFYSDSSRFFLQPTVLFTNLYDNLKDVQIFL